MTCIWRVIIAFFVGIITLPSLLWLSIYVVGMVDERNRGIWKGTWLDGLDSSPRTLDLFDLQANKGHQRSEGTKQMSDKPASLFDAVDSMGTEGAKESVANTTGRLEPSTV